jgi:hypothetical protein
MNLNLYRARSLGRLRVNFLDYGWLAQVGVKCGQKRQAVNLPTRRRDYLTPAKKASARAALRAWMKEGRK